MKDSVELLDKIYCNKIYSISPEMANDAVEKAISASRKMQCT